MCLFCNNLIYSLSLSGHKEYSDFYIVKNQNKMIKYKDTIIFSTCTNVGRLIPMNVICEARKQRMQNGIDSINTKWFDHTFHKPFSSVPYSLRILKEIVQ
jgi:hypothetical protein